MVKQRLDSTFITLGRRQTTEIFRKSDSDSYLNNLVEMQAIREIMFMAYESLVWKKALTRIEELGSTEKAELKKYTMELARGRLSVNDSVKLAKALVALEYFLNEHS